MKLVILLSLASIAYSAPVALGNQNVQILRYENDNNGQGQYNFEFETSDGTVRKEQSEVVNAGDPENEHLIVRGEFSYVGPDGVIYTVTYIADENGFQPQGEHLPSIPGVGQDGEFPQSLKAGHFPPLDLTYLLG